MQVFNMCIMQSVKKNYLNYKNLIFVAFLAFLFFTPWGKDLKVWVIRQMSFSPSIETSAEKMKIEYTGSFVDLDGNKFLFETLKGKPTLVSFWATWCPPCVAEMPSIQALYNDYKDQVNFVLISEEEPQKVRKFSDKNDYNLPMFLYGRGLDKQFQTRSIPATFLIDKDGNIHIKRIGFADWNSPEVRQLLNNLIN